ncbi:MAG: NUDIX domain-containing protein [Hyphomicrobiaceae bacterium]|nr:NUDIX domain-containing protein [Hyphomicrobiaceae bacterium]
MRTRLFRILRPLIFRWWSIQRGILLGVRVVVTDEAGQVLLVRHGYTQGWHLPGGGVDHGETCAAAACREVLEETGLEALEEPRLFGVHHNAAIWKGDHVLVYALAAWRRVREISPGFEIEEARFFPLDALPGDTNETARAQIAAVMASKLVGQLPSV